MQQQSVFVCAPLARASSLRPLRRAVSALPPEVRPQQAAADPDEAWRWPHTAWLRQPCPLMRPERHRRRRRCCCHPTARRQLVKQPYKFRMQAHPQAVADSLTGRLWAKSQLLRAVHLAGRLGWVRLACRRRRAPWRRRILGRRACGCAGCLDSTLHSICICSTTAAYEMIYTVTVHEPACS